jgi:hypothetical protein
MECSLDLSQQLPLREYLKKFVVYALATARGYALMARLAQDAGAAHITAQARSRIAEITTAVADATTIEPTPLSVLTGIQMSAVLAAAEHIARSS